MLPRRLEALRGRLLCAGVAPRHVRRYVRELSDHYEDALGAELRKGAEPARAEGAAWARLGSEDNLVQSVLERPELRSKAARFPALAFGVGPVLTWVGVLVATACALRLLPEAAARADQPPWLLDAAHAVCVLYLRVLPVLLGALVFAAAAQRRLRVHWPIAGAALVDLLAGTLSVHLLGAQGQLGVSSSLFPFVLPFSDLFGPKDLAALGEGLLRAVGMLALSAIVHHFRRHPWLRFESGGEPVDRMRWW